ncbi:diguanylate cyclase domain-containing protein [Thalassospira profundimaris]|uniref:bifunctional diguanylate cyclase/phosphodiesterase n=1 Tax=Thalassospira profundimaris TaxID=502049 RepID=UPI00215DA27E|nr:diguanylate cyclase [Thalassospira profundimaris]
MISRLIDRIKKSPNDKVAVTRDKANIDAELADAAHAIGQNPSETGAKSTPSGTSVQNGNNSQNTLSSMAEDDDDPHTRQSNLGQRREAAISGTLNHTDASDVDQSAFRFELNPTTMAQAEAPVMVMRADGTPLFANKNAMGFADGIREGLFPEINTLIAHALETPGGVVQLLTFEVQRGTATLELTALPMHDDLILLLPRDVSMDRNLREALIDSRQRYRDIVEVSSAFAWETDESGKFVFVSPRGAMDYQAKALLGRLPVEFMIEKTDQDAEQVFRTTRAVRDVPIWFYRANGSSACLSVSATPIINRAGQWCGARGLAHDITEQRQHETEIANARNRDRLITYIVRAMRDEIDPTEVLRNAATASSRALACTACIIFRSDCDTEHGDMKDVASTGEDIHKKVAAEILSQLPADTDNQETVQGDYWIKIRRCHYHHRINGAVAFLFERGDPLPNEGERAIMDDVADQIGIAIEQADNHDRIVTLSRTDGMTGLLNRRAFFDELKRRYDRLLKQPAPAALMYVDMDNFKLVNDIHGHQRGDEAILTLSRMLQDNTRPGDLVARLGGDEFVLWLDRTDRSAAENRAKDLIAASSSLRQFSGREDRPLGISLGIAVHETHETEAIDDLVQRADDTMYQVKKHGKGSYAIAEPVGQHAPARTD